MKEIFPFASPSCISFMEKMLQLDPNRRISAEEALNDPYFKEQPEACKIEELGLQLGKSK